MYYVEKAISKVTATVAFRLTVGVVAAFALFTFVVAGQADARRGSPDNIVLTGEGAPEVVAQTQDDTDQGVCDIDSAGDFNGDGFQDFVVGLCHENFEVGSARIKYGGANSSDVSLRRQDTWVTMPATSPRVHFGKSVAGGYDVNGDGFDDVVIGAPDANHGDGGAYVIFGSREPATFVQPVGVEGEDVDDTEPAEGTGFIALNPVGSGGDSHAESDDLGDDVAMGPNPRDPSRAAVYVADSGNDNTLQSCDAVFFGDDCGTVWAITNFPYAADHLGSWRDNSASGHYDMTLPAADAEEDGMFSYGCRVDGAFPHGRFGMSVDGGADVTGDRVPDFIVGAPDHTTSDNSGRAHVISGAFCLRAQTRGTEVGAGDRCDDTENEFDCGVVDTNLAGSGYRIQAAGSSDRSNMAEFGTSVAIVDAGPSVWPGVEQLPGDLNGDDVGEVIVGDPEADITGSDSGAAWIVNGLDISRMPGSVPTIGVTTNSAPSPVGMMVRGEGEDDRLGERVAPGGWMDDDGQLDVLVSATRGDNTDRAYVVYGPTQRQAQTGTSSVDLSAPKGSDRSYAIDLPSSDGDAPAIAALDSNLDVVQDLAVGSATDTGMWFLLDGMPHVVHGRPAPYTYKKSEPKQYEKIEVPASDGKAVQAPATAPNAKDFAAKLKSSKQVAANSKAAKQKAARNAAYNRCRKAAKRNQTKLKTCKRLLSKPKAKH